jgi:hypothetical protein
MNWEPHRSSDMEPGHRVILSFGPLFPTGSPCHQCDPVYNPVLAFFRAIFVLCFSLYSVNNRKSTVNSHYTTGRLVTSSQQHDRFLNNVQYSSFVLPIMAKYGILPQTWNRATGSDVNGAIVSSGQKVTRFYVCRSWGILKFYLKSACIIKV